MSLPPPSAGANSTPEAQAALFASDERIHYSRESGTWRLENEDGSEYEFDAAKGTWIALVDEDLLRKQQAAYSIAGVDEATPAAPVLARENKKRKEPEDYTSATAIPEAGPSIKRGRGDKKEKAPGEPRKSKNTAIYVTGLPLDTESEELQERFARCGLIEEDDQGEPKIKMYAKDDGTFSGEALVVYFKEDSVTLALNLLDDAELRLGDSGSVMSVRRAEFGHKNTGGDAQGNNAQPRKTVDKKKATRRIGKMQQKLLEWDDEDGFGPAMAPEDNINAVNKNSRVVVLKYMFTQKELAEDTTLLLDLKEDVREECSTLGEVTNVVLYDTEPDGVMTVKFRDPLSAQACLIKMDGRFFAGRRIEAELYSGKQRFKRSGITDDNEGGSDEAEKKRLDDFASWLMTEGD